MELTFINLLIKIQAIQVEKEDSSGSWRAGVISPVSVITLGDDLTRGCMEFLMAPPGIPGTDFWNQLRVTGSPRASIIAAISERALLFPLALLLIIPLSPSLPFLPLSLSLSLVSPRNPRFFLLLFLPPSFSPFPPFFQGKRSQRPWESCSW